MDIVYYLIIITVLPLPFIWQHLVHSQPGRFPGSVETGNGRENQHDGLPQNDSCQQKTQIQGGRL